MLSRVQGIQKREAKFYQGLEILDKFDFYEWSLHHESPYWDLYEAWKASGYTRKLSPSVDRYNPYRGYTLDNMRWTTHSINSGRIIRPHPQRRNTQMESLNA